MARPIVAGRRRVQVNARLYPFCTAPTLRLTVRATRDPPASDFRILDAIIGESVSATMLENATAAAMVSANSENSRPTSPCRKAIGTNTATRTSVVATTAKATWRAPLKAATSGVSPAAMRR